jgi:geranylgeranyl pyrophosphate synthase
LTEGLWLDTASVDEAAAVTVKLTDSIIDGLLRAPPELEARVYEAMRYSALAPGKRLRPLLVLAGARMFGVARRNALQVAAAIEMVHAYSLIHDDLPCMDDDDLRRGRPTVHKVHGEATAVLVGDGLQSLAFSHLLGSDHPRAGQVARILGDDALRMVEGQALDMAGEHAALGEAQVLELMRCKTGALVAAAVAGGAACAGADADEAYPIGLKLGLAFQIADDLLDLTSDAATLGKRAGKDAAAGKATLPAVLGPAEARRRAEGLLAEALDGLAPLGERAEPLRALARFVLSRGR